MRGESAAAAASCEGVVRVYGGPGLDVVALRGVDVEVPAGAVTAIVGPSGSGKSSLLRILGAFDRPTAGRVRIGGVETTSLPDRRLRDIRRRHVGYVFQRPAENLVSYLTVDDHLRESSRIRRAGGDATDRARALIGELGLADRSRHLPQQLSGGEQQRLAFAAAVVAGPDLVVADEPTGELDGASAAALIDAVRTLADGGTAFVIATHDPAVVAAADRTYHLRHGALEAESTTGAPLAVIDASGRIQLPSSWPRLFPDSRARIEVGDDEVRIVPP
jgi:putative ABC transport system ATP-binding protein